MTALTRPAAGPVPAGTAYEDDFYTWTQEQGARLRAGDLKALDRENLEEIESLGGASSTIWSALGGSCCSTC